MDTFAGLRRTVLQRVERTPRTALTLFAAAAIAGIAALTLTLLPGGGDGNGTALAVQVPEGCNPAAGAADGQIDAPGTLPPVAEGQMINYRLSVGYPDDPDQVLCQAFNVDVWIKLPGEPAYTLACTLPTINEGQTLQCPATVPYTAEGADRTGNVLQAFMYAIGDKHDQAQTDCVTTPDDPNGTPGPICFGVQVTSNIIMTSTPTPTPTATATQTPGTPTATNTPGRNASSTPTAQPSSTAAPATGTPPAASPTSLITTLPATVVPAASPTPIGVTLPPAGQGGGPMEALTGPVVWLALLAIVFAGAGMAVAVRQRR
jgi:hypothetical protein